ncbi:MAG: hypothetical protein GC184_11300 [Rhizobiales bacterium]|nr:hypothetical protein [Hyphomicrobiales bacterium]
MSEKTPSGPNPATAMQSQDPHFIDELVLPQLEELNLIPGRPLIVSDADEVLVKFIAGLETWLETRGLWLNLQSFMLTGNIRDKLTDEPLKPADMPQLMEDFFADHTHALIAVEGAAAALEALSKRAQIVVLSNIPISQRGARAKSLAAQGMDYPVIANKGLKGGAVRHLAASVNAPVFFLDDIPHNIASVAKAHEPTHRLHFIADERLAKLIPPSDHSHFHTSKWADARDFIEGKLSEEGF